MHNPRGRHCDLRAFSSVLRVHPSLTLITSEMSRAPEPSAERRKAYGADTRGQGAGLERDEVTRYATRRGGELRNETGGGGKFFTVQQLEAVADLALLRRGELVWDLRRGRRSRSRWHGIYRRRRL